MDNTRKITRAMEMVAASKRKKHQRSLAESKTYLEELVRVARAVMSENSSLTHPLFEARQTERVLAVMITSDSGLCGSYNTNIFETLELFLAEQQKPVSFLCVGRQGANYLKRHRREITLALETPKLEELEKTVQMAASAVSEKFLACETDLVFLLYTELISNASFRPKIERLLPLERTLEQTESGHSASSNPHLLEPDASRVLDLLIPRCLKAKLEHALKESLVAEQTSRMIAMKQATDNAVDMIDALTLLRNKMRQASITKELIEIIAGSRTQ